MLYSEINGVKVSRLGMNGMHLPVTGADPAGPVDAKAAFELVDRALECGITYFDTATFYHGGQSETVLGDALARHPRDSYVIADRFFNMTDRDHAANFEAQLQRLHTDHIDFYLVSSINDANFKRYLKSGCIDYFLEQKAAGRIGQLGFSSYAKPKLLQTVLDTAAWDFCSLMVNGYDWAVGTAAEEVQLAADKGLSIIVMEPLRGGALVDFGAANDAEMRRRRPDISPAAWGYQFMARTDAIKCVLGGLNGIPQLLDSVEVCSNLAPLSDADAQFYLDVCSHAYDGVTVPCLYCNLCVDACPRNIDIPLMVRLYNEFKASKPKGFFKGGETKRKLTAELSKVEKGHGPDECMDCCNCMRRCPIAGDIPSVMQELAKYQK